MGKRFNELTPERLACLQIVATAHTGMSHDDNALLPFCDDKSTLTDPDIFNQCHEAGWLKSWHDSRLDCSYVELTQQGRAILKDSPHGR